MTHLRSFEVQQLLHNKFVVILGDSIQRSVYKDLVLLLQRDGLLTYKQLKVKGELSFEQDKLVNGGQMAVMHNGIDYREVREFCTSHHLVRFYFLTRVYNTYVQDILKELQSNEHTPDVVIINSCLWDISRYGKDPFFGSYRENLENLFRHLNQVLPKSCLLVWNTAMPVGEKITGGFLPKKQSSLSSGLKKKVIEANFYSVVEAKKHNLDVLDLHFHFRQVEGHRQVDGVHWNQLAHRHLSQLLLAHMADAWGVDLPCHQPVSQLIRRGPGQGVERQPQTSRERQALLPSPSSSPRQRPLLPYPPPYLPLYPQPPPITCHPTVSPRFLPASQDSFFTSDEPFQSDQFLNFNSFDSDVPSSAQTGLDFEAGFMFDTQPPTVPGHTPYYQQPAPVVHRGFPQNVPRGPYAPWRPPPKSYRRQARAHPQPRPH